jgi:GPH family glycoside/pentoside/hexuronide:cation symporter
MAMNTHAPKQTNWWVWGGATVAALIVLAAIGYAANQAQTGASQTGIALLQTAIPGGFALMAVGIIRFYDLTGSQLEKIQADLKARAEAPSP